MRVVVNASPLIALSLVDRLDLLQRLFDDVIVPPAVYDELTAKDATKTGVSTLRSAAWIKVLPLAASPTIEPLWFEGELTAL